jgi:two-component system, NtrC family, sensor kinase
MKAFITYLFVCFSFSFCVAQDSLIDSLTRQLNLAKQDTNQALILSQLSYLTRNSNSDTSLFYAQQALSLARKIKFPKAEIGALNSIGSYFRVKGDLPKSLNYQIKALEIAENNKNLPATAMTLHFIGTIYMDLKDFKKASIYTNRAYNFFEAIGDKERQISVLINMAAGFRLSNQPQLSLKALQKVKEKINKTTSSEQLAFYFAELGSTQFELGSHQIGFENQKKAIEIYKDMKNMRRLSTVYNTIALDYRKLNQLDSTIYYAQNGLSSAESIGFKREILVASKLLAQLFEAKDNNKALSYYKIAMEANDELYGANRVLDLQKIVFDEQEKQRKEEVERINVKNQFTQYLFLIGLLAVSFIGLILYRSNRQQKKTNTVLERTLNELKSTQTQLIQSEKLASLGELTAGIAHEIQNPLNFVNNFSELSVDLAKELKEEIKKPEKDWELIDDLTNDLTENQEKINHHGKRASSIVKGMLEHSRTSTSVKELTDINALADEYLRLAYHGLRAKDNSFNAILETHFDENLPKIEVIPQDIGRVLLNLINNAFYAVNFPTISNPTVTISTQTFDNQIIIKIKDNGIGMNKATKAKIFQPFFTTKPTGQGTGLGLSLAYDIITKGHGGTIDVESVEGEGSTFIVKLPI